MSATDTLCAMLADRCEEFFVNDFGVNWRYYSDPHTATESMDGTLIVTGLTPAQAIAATLGAGVCRLKPWEMERDTGYYDCMQCGCGYVADVGDWAEWHFCPNCGAKVVGE